MWFLPYRETETGLQGGDSDTVLSTFTSFRQKNLDTSNSDRELGAQQQQYLCRQKLIIISSISVCPCTLRKEAMANKVIKLVEIVNCKYACVS